MGGKTKTTSTSNSTSTAAPPSWTAGGLQAIGDKVTQGVKAGTPAYTGDFVAGADYGAAMDAYNKAAGAAPGMADWIMQGANSWKPTQANFQAYNPTNTDAQLTSAISAASQPVIRNLMQSVLPSLKSSALDAGAYSGDRATALLPQLALDDASRNLNEITAKYVYDNSQANADRGLTAWQTENNFNMNNAQMLADQNLNYLGMMPSLANGAMQMQTSAGDLLSQAAMLDQQQRQQQIDNALQQHQYQVMQPYEGLDIAASLLNQVGQGYGTTTQSGKQTQTQSTSGLGPILQGALGLAGGALSFPLSGGTTLAGSLFAPKAAAAAQPQFTSPTRNIFPM